jgi:hypothetical protein
MREPENCELSYCGFKSPRTNEEIDFEILGLESAIARAMEKISSLKQTQFLAKIALENNFSDLKEMFKEDKGQ